MYYSLFIKSLFMSWMLKLGDNEVIIIMQLCYTNGNTKLRS